MQTFSLIANLIYMAVSGIAIITGIILTVIFAGKIKKFLGPALILSLITFFLCIFKFLPFIFDWPAIIKSLGNPDYSFYLALVVTGVPYDLIKIFTFIITGLVLFEYLEITPFKFKEKWRKINYWGAIGLSCLIFIGITELLIYLTDPKMTEAGENFYNMVGVFYKSKELGSFFIAAYAPLLEEISYRFFWTGILLNLLKKFRWRWEATFIITSVIWSFGHAGVLEPEWVKLLQIFIYGIVLGILFRKKGIEACIISHLVSNILLTLIHLNSEI